MVWWCALHTRHPLSSSHQQRASLVNVKLKWVKDRALDSAVTRDRHLRPALHLVSLLSSSPSPLSVADFRPLRRRLQLRRPLAFLRRFPSLFLESPARRFHLTPAALHLHQQELLLLLPPSESPLLSRLRRLLMLSASRSLPFHTIDQLAFDLGLPFDYPQTLIPRYPQFFRPVNTPDDERVWLNLVSWDPDLAVSELQKTQIGADNDRLSFPLSFTRGFGLKRKCLSWLQEWQTLPYTSPYADSSGLDPRTDESEKRIVGVFHELLHLTVGKKTERRNVSNLRKPLSLPQKFTKVFERHPGIFYLSPKMATQTVVLREAYGGGRELIMKDPIVGIRERYAALMREGMRERPRRGAKKEMVSDDGEEGNESDDSDCFGSDSVSEDDEEEVVGGSHS